MQHEKFANTLNLRNHRRDNIQPTHRTHYGQVEDLSSNRKKMLNSKFIFLIKNLKNS